MASESEAPKHDCGSIVRAVNNECFSCSQTYIDDADLSVFHRLVVYESNTKIFESVVHRGISEGWLIIDAPLPWALVADTISSDNECCQTNRPGLFLTALHKTMLRLLSWTNAGYCYYSKNAWLSEDIDEFKEFSENIVARVVLLIENGAKTEFTCGCTVESIAKKIPDKDVAQKCLQALGGGSVTKAALSQRS